MVQVRPLSARSTVLSVLLGAHPPALPARELVRAAELFGIAQPTLRVALTRMVTAGDLVRADGDYRLSERLLARQRTQDERLDPPRRAWRGRWELAVVTGGGREPAERAALRSALARARLAELREGVWLRPDNLKRTLPAGVERFTAAPEEDPAALARRLFDPDGWARAATALGRELGRVRQPARRLALAAALLRQLTTDPVLPDALLPAGWPGAALREQYAAYRAELEQVLV